MSTAQVAAISCTPTAARLPGGPRISPSVSVTGPNRGCDPHTDSPGRNRGHAVIRADRCQRGQQMTRRILGSAAVLAGASAMFFVPTGSAQALGANCDDVGDGNYIQYSWADSDSSFTFQCVNGKWVFVG